MNEDHILIKLVEHDQEFEKINEKLKRLDLIDDVLTGQDKMIGLLTKIDTEVTAIKSANKRHEERIERIETHLDLEPINEKPLTPNPQFQPI